MAWRGIVAGTRPRVGAALLSLAAAAACPGAGEPGTGLWRGWLESPGGELPFGLELSREGDGWRATIINGDEAIDVPRVDLDGRSLTLDFPHYASRIRAEISPGGDAMDGEWTRRSGPDSHTRMAFHARHGEQPRFRPLQGAGPHAGSVDGRWRVRFDSEEEPSVGLFHAGEEGRVTGTFLNTTGDYRYLAGSWEEGRLRLSTFDGAHAFLFEARLREDGTLKGEFWSRDTWHDNWIAEIDPAAELSGGFDRTRWTGAAGLEEVAFPDLEGRPRSLADPEFQGAARIIEVFGTWCPNCNDAAALLAEYQDRYGPRGLAILGLAFEMTGEFSRDAEQVRRYRERYGISYPILLAGTAPKEESTRSLPLLDRIRAYPTFIFVDGAGEVAGVYSGFSGPATGEAHRRLREEFEALIEKLLGPVGTGPSSPETRS